MQRDEVDDEDVATPRGNHVEVCQRAQRRVQQRSGLDTLDPQEVGQDQREDSNTLVIERASDGTRDVTGHNRDRSGSQQASRLLENKKKM